MWRGKIFLILVSLTALLCSGDGCQMEGVSNWLLTISEEMYDTHTGTVFSRGTSNIEAITGISSSEGVDASLYLDVTLDGSNFVISTKNQYTLYEEYETSESMSFSVNFRCSGGSANTLVFDIQVIDTNNNDPIFKQDDDVVDVYEFTIMPPLPPGVQITGCADDNIVVRDVDLTTERIIFEIEDNPYFEISYDGRSSNPKEFLGLIRTKALIRTLPEIVELTIRATDVDRTGDPPITRTATVRVKADDAFEFPEEPAFSQAFYLANYTTNNEMILEDPISLRQGYHEDVTFGLEGELSQNFNLVINGNEVSISVETPLPRDILRTGQLVLVVKAIREYTSGDTATIIVQLPEVLSLEFERTQYDGMIVDNILQPMQLNLVQGYEDGFQVALANEHASFFSTAVQGNAITLSMTPLTSQIIDDNNFITLQVVASNDYGSSTAIVTLQIIKDDNVSPAFEKALYTGEYDGSGLTFEAITLVQGYDDTVTFEISGDHEEYFEVTNDGATVTLTASDIPAEIWVEQRLYLTIEGRKPRSVPATAAISIQLPAARELAFQASSYSGTVQDNTLTHQPIVLSTGYAADVSFILTGDYASYFEMSSTENQVTISLPNSLPSNVILENNFLTLTLSANGIHALPATTMVVLEIIKQDLSTPVFTENIYRASYLGARNIEIEAISLSQGYDNSVTFRIVGDHAQYFQISNDDNNVMLTLELDIPAEVIFREKVLMFNVIADKPFTVGGHATITVIFPEELTDSTVMRFSQNTYLGSFEENTLILENMVLETGYENGTVFTLTGEHASYFTLQNSNNEITIQIGNTPIDEIIEANSLIVLEVNATRERAVSVSTTIVIDIVKVEIIHPMFNEAFYRGVYFENELQFDEVISLTQGYDGTVTFALEGELAAYFSIQQHGDNGITLSLSSNTPITEEVLENYNQLLFTIVAIKPGAASGRAAISIDLPQAIPEHVIIRFTQSSYVGLIENGELYAPTITLASYWEPLQLNLAGDYASYFEVSYESNNVLIRLVNELPADEIEELSFIILNITASYPEAISGNTAILLEIIKPPQIVTPVFEQGYYTGEYSQQGFKFDQTIRLIQGFDETVLFTLAGDDAQWFELVNVDENSLSVRINGNGLAQIRDRSHLIFSVVANKPDSPAARAAIVINLSDLLVTVPLRFSQNFYTGTIDEGILSLATITLEEGYSPDVTFTLIGDYADYFQISNEESTIILQLEPDTPDDIFEAHNVLVLSLEAHIENTKVHTTVILQLTKTDINSLSFEEAYYVGLYSVINGFTFDPQIALIGGHDQILFSLEGDDSNWFRIVENQNTVSLELDGQISTEDIAGRQQLIFTIVATRPDGVTTQSTIIISIIIDAPALSFERNYYLGTIENNAANIETISITDTYSQSVTFTITGELADYFTITSDGASVTIYLQNSIEDDILPPHGVILLELQALASQAMPAYTTLIFSVVKDENVALNFTSTYYTGTYTLEDGLDFQDTITLSEGFDENVQFALEGDSAQYFEIVVSGHYVQLHMRTDISIPSETVIDNQYLIFTIRADKPNARTVRATIVISLSEVQDVRNLQFDQLAYLGSIESGDVNLNPIILSDGYTEDVLFTLHGELASYFNLVTVEGTVTINLVNQIPDQSLPNNGIVLLELHAAAPQARSARASIVLNLVQENIEGLEFNQTYYTGTYTAADELIVEDTITLAEGYGENVLFTLEGDDSQYFEAVATDNNVILRVVSPIPPAVTMNNKVFVFSLHASRSGAIARAAIVVTLSDEFNEDTSLLGFNRITYSGKIEDNTINMDSITLTEGYTSEVTFALYGDLAHYFTLSNEEANVILTLPSEIPESLIPDNNIIVLELRASALQSLSTFAAIVFEVVTENKTVQQLVFNEAYYTGQYDTTTGVTLERAITISEGYDDNVFFALEGENSQYFEAVVSGNSVTLRVSTPIPAAVISNNHHLILTIRAEKPDAITARATIVISLLEELAEDLVLGFDRISYQGTIENNVINLDPITLSEGFTQEVSFTLHGDLRNYFLLSTSEATVTLTMPNSIPDESVPENGIIILELQASAPETMSAHATIVFEFIREAFTPDIEQLVFSETFYTGRYTETGGLVVDDIITLAEGFDENVQFTLKGDDSQYFRTTLSGNTVTLEVIALIPPAVVTNNQQLVFAIHAEKPDAIAGRATIVISLLQEFAENNILGFDRITYIGSIENGASSLEAITLSEGYSDDVSFTLYGDLASYFSLTNAGAVITVTLSSSIPEQSLPENHIIVLELRASAPETISAYATIVYEIIQEENALEELLFSDAYYTGHYSEADGLALEGTITLAQEYGTDVTFALEGENAQYFEVTLSGNAVTLTVPTPIASEVITNNRKLIFTIRADKPTAISARAVIIISLKNENTGDLILGFDRISYQGTVESNKVNMDIINLNEGYTESVLFTLRGDLATYFTLSNSGPIVTITLQNEIPEQSIPTNGIIVLELQASASQAISAYATIVLAYDAEENIPVVNVLAFRDTYYTGHYTEIDGLTFEDITLEQGYDDNVVFALEGDSAQYFELEISGNSVTVRVNSIPPAVVAGNQKLIFVIRADKPDAVTARATIIIALRDEYDEETAVIGFNRINYVGSIDNNVATLELIVLSEGYSDEITFTLHGDLVNNFILVREGPIVSIEMSSAIPEESLPENRIIVLELQASAPQTMSAYATIVFEVVQTDAEVMAFDAPYYVGQYTADGNLIMESSILLYQGFNDNVVFHIEGDHSQWFYVEVSENEITLLLVPNTQIPEEVLENNRKLIFFVVAQKSGSPSSARSIIIISLPIDSENGGSEPGAAFEKLLFEGSVQEGVVRHETIRLSGYEGNDIQLLGEFAELFEISIADEVVTIQASDPLVPAADITYIALQLQAGDAGAVLLLDIIHTEGSELPTVSFGSTSYALTVDTRQSGLIGRVQATADNGERITYSLIANDAHLLQRISINSVGELHLSAPANIGEYSFEVVATTVLSQATGSATIQLTVDAIAECADSRALPPLTVLDRDEESAHRDLFTLDGPEYQGCTFTLRNLWPSEQSWLYLDDTGLHTHAIDREHESIAFMALSQIQVELIMDCDIDTSNIRSKRSVNAESRLDHLGPYDYGDSTWLLGDTIAHNPRRGIVNLIVNDINDNAPIFVNKEQEPIVVAYPIAELEERILPRALAEVEATDADVGENAAIVYWSTEEVLAVSPQSGLVHVRNNAQLENNTILTVNATDLNGQEQGLTGSLDLLVKLIDTSHIAVVTVQNVFLEDEKYIVGNLSASVGYEVKVLRSTVISEEITSEADESRSKREAILSTGASLQLYVYGLLQQEPVDVQRLTEDINVIETVSIADIISLEDHLESLQICPSGRDVALLVSTIVLSVLLFILIVVAAVWFFLRWRKSRKYDEFSDESSIGTSAESPIPPPKSESFPKPRINIEDLKKSERRLQEMLQTPVEEVAIEPVPVPKPVESKVNIPEVPIVIQSIDKLKDADESEDEDVFGERTRDKRKSVVTFNENVEKIIHVEDPPDDSDFEVYKL